MKDISTCETILAENWHKYCYINKAVRKIATQLARKGKEVIRSGLVPLGGDSEENGDNTGGHLPGE